MSKHNDSGAGAGLVLFLLLIAFLLLLAACGEAAPATPITGTVTDRHKEEATTEYECEPDMDGRDAGSLDCEWEDVPECLSMTVTSADGTQHTWCATQEEYDAYAVDDVFPHPAPGTTS